MKVTADKEVFDYLKKYLSEKENKVVRFQLVNICCGMTDLELAYDEQKEDDITYEFNGITFVAKKDFGFLINNIELERTPYGVDIKKQYNYEC